MYIQAGWRDVSNYVVYFARNALSCWAAVKLIEKIFCYVKLRFSLVMFMFSVEELLQMKVETVIKAMLIAR